MAGSPSSIIEMATQFFIRKIQQLSQVQPSQEWMADLRQKLLIEKRTQDLLRQDFDFRASATWGLFSYLKSANWRTRPRLILRPVVAFLVILGLFGLGLGGLVFAAQDSLPGEGFYVLKTAVEQARLVLTKNVENKAKIQAEFTGKRIEELNKIILQPIPAEEKEEKTELAVNQLNQHLTALRDQLPKIEKQVEPKKALVMTETIIRKSVEAEKVLDATREKTKEEAINEPKIAQKLTEVSQAAKEVRSDAQRTLEVLAIMVEKEEVGQATHEPKEAESQPEQTIEKQATTTETQKETGEPAEQQPPAEQKLEIQFLQLSTF